jgi:competence protein ComEC
VPLGAGAAPGGSGIGLASALALAAILARRTLTRAALALAVCGVLGRAPPAAIAPRPPRLVVFDVGAGEALLVEGREGRLLVDAGWAAPAGADLGRSAVAPALRALGVARLDVAVATHADLDHRGGLPAVLGEIEVGELWLPPDPDRGFEELRQAAARAGVPVRERAAGAEVRVGDLAIEVLWPPADAAPSRARGRNEGSLVLRVTVDGSRVLLTGDIGAESEASLVAAGRALRAEVLKVAHHGSRVIFERRLPGCRLARARAGLGSVQRALPTPDARGLRTPPGGGRVHRLDGTRWCPAGCARLRTARRHGLAPRSRLSAALRRGS